MSDIRSNKTLWVHPSKSAPLLSSTSNRISSTPSSVSLIDLRGIESNHVQLLEIKSFPNLSVVSSKYQDGYGSGSILNDKFLKQFNRKLNTKDLLYLDVHDKRMSTVDDSLFNIYKYVIGINAGENTLRLESFRNCLELQELRLPLNNIKSFSISPGEFLKLKILDLSFNELTVTAIYHLGHLNTLKMLNLSSNNIEQLPNGLNMTSFPNLEVFILDHNSIAHPNNFKILSRLSSLSCLSLENNKIWCLPFIESKGSGETIRYQMKLLGINEIMPNEAILKIKPNSFDKNTTLAALKKSNQFAKFMNTSMSKVTSIKHMGIYLRDEKNENLPFMNLRQLNLKENNIDDENCLYAIKTWKQLEELVIASNNIVSLKSSRLKPFKNLVVSDLNIRYCQFACNIYDPLIDPFHNYGLIRRFLPHDVRDETFCLCHKQFRKTSQDENHRAVNLDKSLATVPGMTTLPQPSQHMCQA